WQPPPEDQTDRGPGQELRGHHEGRQDPQELDSLKNTEPLYGLTSLRFVASSRSVMHCRKEGTGHDSLFRQSLLTVGLLALLATVAVRAADAPAGPAYQIVLRSRDAVVTPNRNGNAQTGGGSILVEQPDPSTILVLMAGSAVVGSGCHGSSAGIDFTLEQDLDIVATRRGVRPPRIGMIGRVVGTLQATDPGECGKACGGADQGPGTASLSLGQAHLLSV